MKIVFYFLIALIVLFLIILIIGLILPRERVVQRKAIFNASPQKVYSIVTNNNDYYYRSDLKELKILEKNGDIETWEEISKNSQSITFRTIKKEPYLRYEFEIVKANGFSGYWTGDFKIKATGGTEFLSTEHIVINNPMIRCFSYVFFDLGSYMENYQRDLAKKLGEEYKKG